MVLPLLFLIGLPVTIGLLIAVLRPHERRGPPLLDGMFRYEADLGWPHGVQEEDGERAWVPRADSLPVDGGGDGPADPVIVARVRRT